MPFAVAAYNLMLSGGLMSSITHISLHNSDAGTGGGNEITGGSPAYARQAVTWGTVSGGAVANTNAMVFDVPNVDRILHYGFWSAATGGTYYGYFPFGGTSPKNCFIATFDDSTPDTFTSYGHGLTANENFTIGNISNGSTPSGLTEGSLFFAVSATITADTFQPTLTSGSSSSNGSGKGTAVIFPAVFFDTVAQTKWQIPVGGITVTGALM